jgi:hypothetical protein
VIKGSGKGKPYESDKQLVNQICLASVNCTHIFQYALSIAGNLGTSRNAVYGRSCKRTTSVKGDRETGMDSPLDDNGRARRLAALGGDYQVMWIAPKHMIFSFVLLSNGGFTERKYKLYKKQTSHPERARTEIYTCDLVGQPQSRTQYPAGLFTDRERSKETENRRRSDTNRCRK